MSSEIAAQFECFATFVISEQHPCTQNNGGCLQICKDNVNGHFCSCEKGYELDTDMKSCVGEYRRRSILHGEAAF